MKGKLRVIQPDGTITITNYDDRITLDDLQDAVEGFIEVVPYFFSIDDPEVGARVRCVAFCNEDGKLEAQPYNLAAQSLWQDALDAFFADALDKGRHVGNNDRLVGPVAIVTGDDEFLAAL